MLTLSVWYLGMKATWPGEWPLVLVGHVTTHVALEVLEQDKPKLTRQVVVGQGLLYERFKE